MYQSDAKLGLLWSPISRGGQYNSVACLELLYCRCASLDHAHNPVHVKWYISFVCVYTKSILGRVISYFDSM